MGGFPVLFMYLLDDFEWIEADWLAFFEGVGLSAVYLGIMSMMSVYSKTVQVEKIGTNLKLGSDKATTTA
jgi:hypothetical protein